MPRPCKCRRVEHEPPCEYFKPAGTPLCDLEEDCLSVEGLEAIRLADAEGLSMDEASARMGVSRHTFGRILRAARRVVAEVLIGGKALRVEGGHYRIFPESPVPRCASAHAQGDNANTEG